MHRIAIELLKIDGFTVDANVIARTGKHSMSFQTSLILLEETILHGADIQKEEMKEVLDQQNKKRKQVDESESTSTDNNGLVLGKITGVTKAYWFNLIQLYELIGNEDALKGIWSSLGETGRILLRPESSSQGVVISSDG